jgi:hypothetical protein
MQNEAKLEAQEALFIAIKNQAETNMKAALRATEKAELLRDLAEAYRLAAGGVVPDGTARKGQSARTTVPKTKSTDDTTRRATSTEETTGKAKSTS